MWKQYTTSFVLKCHCKGLWLLLYCRITPCFKKLTDWTKGDKKEHQNHPFPLGLLPSIAHQWLSLVSICLLVAANPSGRRRPASTENSPFASSLRPSQPPQLPMKRVEYSFAKSSKIYLLLLLYRSEAI